MAFQINLTKHDSEMELWRLQVRMSDKALANLARMLIKYRGQLLDTFSGFDNATETGTTGHLYATCLIKLPKGFREQFQEDSNINLHERPKMTL